MSKRHTPFSLEMPKFGSFIRRVAQVTSEDVEHCLRIQAERGGRLGEIMVTEGIISVGDVWNALRQQAQWAAELRAADLKTGSFPLPVFFSLCFPCYNEADVLLGNLQAACTILPEFVREFEVIVVDDGSHDSTGAITKEFSSDEPRVRLVQHVKNRGYGAAVSTGFRAARGELVCLNDGDGQFSLIDLPQILIAHQSADVAIGYRYNRADSAIRSVNAKCWNWLIRRVLGVRVRDLDCAFKLFPKWVVDQLEMTAEGACISGEIMAQVSRGGLRVAQVPVNHYPRYHGEQSGANLRVITKAFRELPQLWKYRKCDPIRPSSGVATSADEKVVATFG